MPEDALPLPEQVYRCFLQDDPEAEAKHQETANVRLVQQLYAAILRGDYHTVVEHLGEDIEWQILGPAELPFCGTVRGKRDAASALRRNFSGYQHIGAEVRDVVAQGRQVVVMCRETVRLEPLEEQLVLEWVQVFTIVGGQVVKFREFFDTLTMRGVVERIVG
ncbi:MAG: nuclear transport factor 2 family protein [Planctomycetia bacterium]|nr:nuclear transport factor 2 family protein [Planctomycetia bacterium]